jgi:long-subunit fatty acid transport protein
VKYLQLPLFIAATALANTALAQGYYSGTQGARAAGRAGAFTARADDVSAVELNPAGLAGIRTTIQVGNRFSHNAYDYRRQSTIDWGTTDAAGNSPTVQFGVSRNEKPWQFLDPFVGVATNFGLKDWGFAIAAYAPAGIAREQYSENGGARYMMISRDSQIMNYTASVAWKLRDVFGVGATFQWIAVPSLKYRLIINGDVQPRGVGATAEKPVNSGLDMRTTVSGSDMFTPNLILGTWLRPVEYLQVGVSAQVIPTSMNIKGHLAVDPVYLDTPVVLVRGNARADDVTLNLPLPIKLREGVRYRHIRDGAEVFDLEFDIAYEFWSRVGTFTMESNGIQGNWSGANVNVGRIDIQKHWKNVVTLMLGGDYAVVPNKFTARAGTFYTSGLSDPAYAQVDFVSGPQLGGTLGLSVFAGPLEVAAAYEYRHMLPVSLTERESRVYQQAPGSPCKPPYTDATNCSSHYPGVPSPPVNAGTYHANSHVAALDLLYRF